VVSSSGLMLEGSKALWIDSLPSAMSGGDGSGNGSGDGSGDASTSDSRRRWLSARLGCGRCAEESLSVCPEVPSKEGTVSTTWVARCWDHFDTALPASTNTFAKKPYCASWTLSSASRRLILPVMPGSGGGGGGDGGGRGAEGDRDVDATGGHGGHGGIMNGNEEKLMAGGGELSVTWVRETATSSMGTPRKDAASSRTRVQLNVVQSICSRVNENSTEHTDPAAIWLHAFGNAHGEVLLVERTPLSRQVAAQNVDTFCQSGRMSLTTVRTHAMACSLSRHVAAMAEVELPTHADSAVVQDSIQPLFSAS
jgi:hypothetical protein